MNKKALFIPRYKVIILSATTNAFTALTDWM